MSVKDEKTPPLFKIVTRDKSENTNVIAIKSGDENLFSFIGEDKQNLAEALVKVCNNTVAALILGVNETVRELDTEAGNITKASDDLRLMLNPLKLRSLILRTRCNLCPV